MSLTHAASLRLLASPLTYGERELQREVRAFMQEEADRPGYRPGLGIAAPHDPEFSQRLAARGWVGMAIPAEYGGGGRSAVERFLVTEELMAAGAPIGAHYVADRQTAPLILRVGSEAQRRRFLPEIAAGRCYFALGMSEPDAGSDLAAVRTTAVREDGGWRLTGTKLWTSNAHRNHYVVVLCRTSPRAEDRHNGLSQMIVDLRSPGVTVRPIPFIDGSQHFNEVVFDDAYVPDEMLLGEVGQGWRQVTDELGYERSGPDRYLSTFPILSALVAGAARIGRTPEMAEAIGSLVPRLHGVRQLCLALARGLDRNESPTVHAALVKDVGTRFEQFSLEVMRRVAGELDPFADDLFQSLLSEGILTGPAFTLRGGTTEILRSVAAKGLIR